MTSNLSTQSPRAPFRLAPITHPARDGVKKVTAASTFEDEATVLRWKAEMDHWCGNRAELSSLVDEFFQGSKYQRFGAAHLKMKPDPNEQKFKNALAELTGLFHGPRTTTRLREMRQSFLKKMLPLHQSTTKSGSYFTSSLLEEDDLFHLPPSFPQEAVLRLLTHPSERVRLRLLSETTEGQTLLTWFREILAAETLPRGMILINQTGERVIRHEPVLDGLEAQDCDLARFKWNVEQVDLLPVWHEVLRTWKDALSHWRHEMDNEGIEWTPLLNRCVAILGDSAVSAAVSQNDSHGLPARLGVETPEGGPSTTGTGIVEELKLRETDAEKKRLDARAKATSPTRAGWFGQSSESRAFQLSCPVAANWLESHPLDNAALSAHMRQSPHWQRIVWRYSPTVAQTDVLLGRLRTIREEDMRALFRNRAMTAESIRLVRNWALFDLTQVSNDTNSWSQEGPLAVRVLNALYDAGQPLSTEDIERLSQYLDFSSTPRLRDRLCRMKDIMTQPWGVDRLLPDTKRGSVSLEVIARIVGAAPLLTAPQWMVQLRRLAEMKDFDDSYLAEVVAQSIIKMLHYATPQTLCQVDRIQWRVLMLHPNKEVRESVVRCMGSLQKFRHASNVPVAPSATETVTRTAPARKRRSVP